MGLATKSQPVTSVPGRPRPMAGGEPIYLDHSATTPLLPEVRAAMEPYLTGDYGNPSGAYAAGRRARCALEEARGRVAGVLGCRSDEVVFTSGGTESDNLAVRGVAKAALRMGRGRHVVVTAVEHKAVLTTALDLGRHGFDVTVVPCDSDGRVDTATVIEAVRPDTVLVSVMLANNEVGTLMPVGEIGSALRPLGVPLHTDAVQAGAWLDTNVDALNVDLLSLSAHKLYGPKGIGALYVRQGTDIDTCQTGGGQEHGLRCGTENVAGAVGFARALESVAADRTAAAARATGLRNKLASGLEAIEGVRLTGALSHRLPGHVSLCVAGAPADALLLGLDMRDICASSGSACSSGRAHASHVLTAMGISPEDAQGALRLTMGRGTTEWQVDRTVEVLTGLIPRVRRVLAI